MAATLGELAARFGCELHGDPGVVVSRVGTLSSAAPDAITFLANSLYRAQLARHARRRRHRRAARSRRVPRREPRARRALSHVRAHRRGAAPAGAPSCPACTRAPSSPRARASPRAAQIDAHAVDRQRLHDRRRRPSIGAGAVLGANVASARARGIGPRVTLLDGVRIGERCIVHPGAVIGADGFGFAPDRGAWQKIPQLGSVVDRRRRRDRRQHDDRPRHDRGHRHRGRREARQPRADRAQRAPRRAHDHGRDVGRRGQHESRQALYDRRRRRHDQLSSRSATTSCSRFAASSRGRLTSPARIPATCPPRRPPCGARTPRASASSTRWRIA